MADLDIIESVDEPNDWVNGLIVVEKLRICLDPQPHNQAIKQEHLHLPTTEELFSQMSKLDASSSYWQVKVDRERSDLLTFGTTIGRFTLNDYLMVYILPVKFFKKLFCQNF